MQITIIEIIIEKCDDDNTICEIIKRIFEHLIIFNLVLFYKNILNYEKFICMYVYIYVWWWQYVKLLKESSFNIIQLDIILRKRWCISRNYYEKYIYICVMMTIYKIIKRIFKQFNIIQLDIVLRKL